MANSEVLTARDVSPSPTSWWARLWTPFWVLPMAVVLIAFGLALGLPSLDSRLKGHLPYVFTGGPDAARSMLTTIAGAMISVTGLVFSITLVVLQLASSQFTPRVVGTFLRNRVTQFTLGVFAASFIYSLTVLRAVRGSAEHEFVPQLSVSVAFLLVIASMVLFIAFIHHITTAIQVSQVISRVGDATSSVLEHIYRDEVGSADIDPRHRPTLEVACDERHGRVVEVNYGHLMKIAEKHDSLIEVVVSHGEPRTLGQPIVRLSRDSDIDGDEVVRQIRLASERELADDPGFGLRQLVDIAARALSPGVNDPTTAVQVIDELHRLIRPLVAKQNPSPVLCDEHGQPRVLWKPQQIESLLRLSFVEIIHYGADAPAVRARLASALNDLRTVARAEHGAVLSDLASRLEQES